MLIVSILISTDCAVGYIPEIYTTYTPSANGIQENVEGDDRKVEGKEL